MPDTEKPKTYEKNTKEQYEALGRFVEAFEAMVNEVRESTIALIERDGKHRRLIEIVLHHQVLTAKPLYEIFRAVDPGTTLRRELERAAQTRFLQKMRLFKPDLCCNGCEVWIGNKCGDQFLFGAQPRRAHRATAVCLGLILVDRKARPGAEWSMRAHASVL